MSNKLANVPAIALSAYFLILPRLDANKSTQDLPLQNYLHQPFPNRANDPTSDIASVATVDKENVIKANIKTDADSQLKAEFTERADRWENETAIHSAPGPALLHKDYIAIIAAGVANKKIIIPMILKRLPISGADWFFALENISGVNPAKDAENFTDALNAWHGWAKSQGLIEVTNEVLAA
jgi:hypothetical protein